MNHTEYTTEVTELRRLDRAYRAGTPEVEDSEFDLRKDRLERFETLNPSYLDPNSPTQVVEEVSGENLLKHTRPAQSLRKTTTREELETWASTVKNETLYVSKKADGVSCIIHYDERGNFLRALTRGDGTYGEDISAKVQLIPSVPNKISTGPIEVRGELVQNEADRPANMKTSRNAVAGAINGKDPNRVLVQKVHFAAFDLVDSEDAIPELRALGFEVVPTVQIQASEVYSSVDAMFALETPYLCDGVVAKVKSFKARDALGSTSTAPRGAIAFKRAGETAQARITGLKLQVGKSGSIGLVYTIDPVVLEGVEITNLTAHNFSEIRRKDVRKGDIVTIIRRGGVIPGVEHVTAPENRTGMEEIFEMPTTCPGCSSPLEVYGNSQQLKCTSDDCIPQLVRRLVHWSSRKAADIDSLSTSWIETFVEAGLLSDIASLYQLTFMDLIGFPNMGETRARKLLDSIEKSKQVGLRKALVGFSIQSASEGSAKRLCAEYETLEDLVGASIGNLASVPDVGLVVATSLYTFFQDPTNQALFAKLKELGVDLNRKPEDAPLTFADDLEGLAFAGKKVVITGALDYGSRDEFSALLTQNGAQVVGSVSRQTDFLVCGKSVGKAKTDKAKQVGTTVITEQDALNMLGL